MLKANFGFWTNNLPESLVTQQCPSCEDQAADWETNVIECRHCESTGLILDRDKVEFRRGFVEEAFCTAEDWFRHGDAILKVTPLRQVTLTTAPPVEVRPKRLTWTDSEGRTSAVHLDALIISKGRVTIQWHKAESISAENIHTGLEPFQCWNRLDNALDEYVSRWEYLNDWWKGVKFVRGDPPPGLAMTREELYRRYGVSGPGCDEKPPCDPNPLVSHGGT